jgi:hypothetical protein
VSSSPWAISAPRKEIARNTNVQLFSPFIDGVMAIVVQRQIES